MNTNIVAKTILYIVLLASLASCNTNFGIYNPTKDGSTTIELQTPTETPTEPLPTVDLNLFTQIPETTDEIKLSTPTPMPTDEPLPTATPISLTEFHDDFDGQLAEGWIWVRENRLNWSLADKPGTIRLITDRGGLGGSAGYSNNILLREAPSDDFEIETLMEFKPVHNYQFAGLIIYESDKSFIQFGRAFCDLIDACVNDGIYFDKVDYGEWKGNFASPAFMEENIYLRLKRVQNKYLGQYSKDGINWITVGPHTFEGRPVMVGIIAHQDINLYKESAYFDYFKVIDLTTR